MALRDQSTGIDVVSRFPKIGYYDMFTHIANTPLIDCFTTKFNHYEVGYVIFNKLISYISKNPQILLIACAIIQAGCFFVVINKTSKNPLLSTIIYLSLPCYFIYFSGLRQGIAISITMIAFLMIKERKPIKFILLVVLAWLFHSSAIIFLIAYPLYYMKRSNVWKLASIIIIPVVYAFRMPIFSVFSQIFKDDAEVSQTGAITLFVVFIAIYIFLTMFSNENNIKLNGCTNLFWIACIVQSFSGLHNLAMRVGYYFMIYAVIAVPEILADDEEASYSLNYQYKDLFSIFIFIACAFYGLYVMFYGSTLYQPYSFFWEHI